VTEGAKRETWRDWWPADVGLPETITRAELLARLADDGVMVSERQLRYWEAAGALPRPPRARPHGTLEAVYPAWYPGIVAMVPRLHKGEGLGFDAIRPRVQRAFMGRARAPWHVGLYRSPGPRAPDSLVRELRRFFAQIEESGEGGAVTEARLTIRTEGGVSHGIVFTRDPVPPEALARVLFPETIGARETE
jgi:hypothetical protein